MRLEKSLFILFLALLNYCEDARAQDMDCDPTYTPQYWCESSGGIWNRNSDFEEEYYCECPIGMLDARDSIGRGICVADPRYSQLLIDLAEAESRGR